MAKSNTSFKIGQSGNPSGRPQIPEDIRKAVAVTQQAFIRVASSFLSMDREQIQQKLQDPTSSMLEIIVGGIVAKAAKDQDQVRAAFILDRVIGKPKDAVIEPDDIQTKYAEAHDKVIEMIPREKMRELLRIKSGNADET